MSRIRKAIREELEETFEVRFIQVLTVILFVAAFAFFIGFASR